MKIIITERQLEEINRFQLKDTPQYRGCLMSDLTRMELIDNFLQKLNDNPEYNTEEPDYEIHVDDPDENCTRVMTMEEFINKIKTDDEFAKKWGELGPIYGSQWRDWGSEVEFGQGESVLYGGIDQIQNLINDLKTNPDSRRLMVSAWDVGSIDLMVLPPCHYGFQMYTRELSLKERVDYGTERGLWKLGQTINYMHCDELNIPTRAISLSWNQRSVDVFLGLPFNIASYGLLLEMIAREVNMVPEHLIGHLGDTHLYSNHLDQAQEQLERIPRELPIMKISSGHNFRAAMAGKVDEIDINDFMLVGYNPHPSIKAPLSN
jgi:thymidylate synthase